MTRSTAEVKVTKKADDPLGVVRVSVGGLGDVIPNGVYCVYRGDKERAIRALRLALLALENLRSEPDISPDDGKQYA